ncbi:MAG TPA: PEP-CTERM sorting domain-containing protein [Methanomicrobia archaeon]|nr:PEP-CTERM sorting domain-containing protein [Methanomicrobia archaeon]HEX59343.1 PEP-CTERM sorting domain-containing protein [Methanomicrobia archaeon]
MPSSLIGVVAVIGVVRRCRRRRSHSCSCSQQP